MQALLLDGVKRIARSAAEGVMKRVFEWIGTFFRRQLIGVWMAGMEVPKGIGMLKENTGLFLKNSAYHSLQSFFSEMPRGAAVFWAPATSGKTYTIAHMDTSNKEDRRFVYVNFSGGDAKTIFYAQMGLNANVDTKPLSHYLPKGVFFTFIFDHFDNVMTSEMIATLVKDSNNSPSFNLLIIVNKRLNAQTLLMSCAEQRETVKLLGPPYCGRWSAAELGEFADPRYNDLVDQCGTLSPMISIRNKACSQYDTVMLLRVAKIGMEWEMGERMLEQYRVYDV